MMMATAIAAMTLLDLLGAGADDHPALVAPEKPALTYGADARECRRAGGAVEWLRPRAAATGSRSRWRNGPEVILAFCAATLCGTAAPLNPKYKQEEFAFYFEDTQREGADHPAGRRSSGARGRAPEA